MYCFLPINSLALGTLPPEKVKNASGLYNLTRNLGGALGLAVANTMMIYLNKQHYAVLREHVTAGSPQAEAFLSGLTERFSAMGIADPETSALKQLTNILMQQAEILTLNILFHTLSIIFLMGLLLIPWIKKVSPDVGEVAGH